MAYPYTYELYFLLVTVAVFIFVVDDLFVDLYSLFFGLRPRPLAKETLYSSPHKNLAIMIANWKEEDVLEAMVRGNMGHLEYQQAHFFLGVYPNDLETLKIAKQMENLYPQVHVVINRENGPTYKGQMLNEVIHFIFAFEKKEKTFFEGFILHDSEDILDPQIPYLYSYGLEKADFVQTPVFSLPTKTVDFIAGTYMDEFSEVHTKDLLVRQNLGAALPSAGVGTCLSRRLISRFLLQQKGCVFLPDSLTEDYQLGLQAAKWGFSSRFLCHYLEGEKVKQVIATKEFFPRHYRQAVRQKARWTTGIAFQGYKNIGWFGDFWQRYFLWRDRKGPLNALLTLNIFLVLFMAVFFNYESILKNNFLRLFFLLNTLGMCLRLLVRTYKVERLYGFEAAAFTVLRWPFGMTINMHAGLKSIFDYAQSSLTGKKIKWAKTQHRLPENFGCLTAVKTEAVKTLMETNKKNKKIYMGVRSVMKILIFSFISLFIVSAVARAQDVKGFNLTENGALTYEAAKEGEEKTGAQLAVDGALALGANHIVLNVRAKMEGPKSVDIIPLTGTGSVSVEARKMSSLVKYIKSLGMTVGIRPILFVVGPNGEFPYVEVLSDGSEKTWWHGNIQPQDPNRWFDNFQLYLDRYLTIAKLTKVDEFTIGAELYSMTVGIEDQWLEHPHGFPGHWNKLLRYVRKKLGDQVRIMYDINFTDDTDSSSDISRSGGELERWRYRLVDLAEVGDEEEQKIWQELLDFWNGLDAIGIDMYRSLAFASDQIPSLQEDLVDILGQRAFSYASQLDVTMLEISIYSESFKPVILKEVGFRSVENAFIDPFTYATAQGSVNVAHQAAGYEALFRGFWDPGFEWFSGFVFWDVPIDPALHGSEDRGFSPLGKEQTEDLIRGYFKK